MPRQPVRVTIGGRSWDLADDGSVQLGPAVAGPAGMGQGVSGTCLVRSADGPRRVLWALRPATSRDHAGRLELELVVDGWLLMASVEPLDRVRLREKAQRGAGTATTHGPHVIRAPIPGRIGSVRVSDGEAVEEGASLLTLEAMKMENVVRAPRAGTIARVAVAAGQTVELGDSLVELT
jgi:biotin carboxyl carrier protein